MTELLARPATTWQALRIDTPGRREDADRLVVDVLGPLGRTPGVRRWFFLRYSEDGNHLRWRLDAPAPLAADLAATVADRTGLPVAAGSYERETARYGGAEAIGVAEDVFCASTALALDLLGRTENSSQRLGAAVDLVLDTARALGLDQLDTVAWLRANAYSWRWHLGPEDGSDTTSALLGGAVAAARSRAAAITRRWQREPDSVWARLVRDAVRDTPSVSGPHRLGVWSSQLHLLLNRIGITPDEERWLDWMIAAALELPDGTGDFFDPSPAAADRRYLAQSRYVPAEMPRQAPEDAAPRPALLGWSPDAGTVELPRPQPPNGTLAEALRARRSTRGPHHRLEAAQLADLLGTAVRPAGVAGRADRAYPSAGGQLAARLRVAVREVDGVPAGLYETEHERGGTVRLRRLGRAPGPRELESTSMWFRAGRPGPDQIDTTTVPAVLALYVDLAAMRARYGLRALRFALLEAGHLAQNLALTATALELALCPVGGFYDDPAHEVFQLDGVDRALAYLLPLGGPVPISSANGSFADSGAAGGDDSDGQTFPTPRGGTR